MNSFHSHRIIDAHHHLWPAAAIADQTWRPSNDAGIDRAFELPDLEPLAEAAGVGGTVLMQSVDAPEENERLFDYARRSELVLGVVAWAPLTQPAAAAAVIEQLASAERGPGHDPLVGVRCLIGRSEPDWATSAQGLKNFARLAQLGLAWDVVPITPAQLSAVVAIAHAVPELRIVVDHLARPPLDGGPLYAWQESVHRLATCPNIAMKLSVGVDALSSAWPRWAPEELSEVVRIALTELGPERCMVASNWPVVLLKTDYVSALTDVARIVSGIVATDEEYGSAVAGTAARWYGLKLDQGDASHVR